MNTHAPKPTLIQSSPPTRPGGQQSIGRPVAVVELGQDLASKAAEVTSAAQLNRFLIGLPRAAQITGAIRQAAPAASERLFGFVRTSCRITSAQVLIDGNQLSLDATGDKAIRCIRPMSWAVIVAVPAMQVPVGVIVNR